MYECLFLGEGASIHETKKNSWGKEFYLQSVSNNAYHKRRAHIIIKYIQQYSNQFQFLSLLSHFILQRFGDSDNWLHSLPRFVQILRFREDSCPRRKVITFDICICWNNSMVIITRNRTYLGLSIQTQTICWSNVILFV